MIEATLGKVAAGEDLSMDEMSAAVEHIMRGECSDGEIAVLLTALRTKGETVAEVAGAAAAMRRHMTPIRTHREGLIDTCGTGGDGSGTFNISTAAAIVTAAAGVPVAKHGNRRVSSRSGSADVLAMLGVNVEAPIPVVERCLDDLGICFCFARLCHPSMKHVAAVRDKLGVPTIFNLLGPLSNPAGAPYQLLGVGRPELRPLLSHALALLGTTRAVVVCGEDQLDEVTLAAATNVTEVTSASMHEHRWTHADFGLATTPRETLAVDGPEASAAMIREVLAGKSGPARDYVLANSAAALWTAGKVAALADGTKQAAAAIDSGAARELLARWAALSNAS